MMMPQIRPARSNQNASGVGVITLTAGLRATDLRWRD
jgi:hypothetical protein